MKRTLAFGLVVAFLFAACTSQRNQDSTITIGALLPLTGDAQSYGAEFQNVINLAVQKINTEGGVQGKKINIVYEDGKCNPKDGALAAQKLVNIDQVKLIIGGACSGETLGAAPITEAAKVILLSPSASSPDITTAGDFVFRTNPSDAFAGKVAADVARQKGYRKAAIIHETSDYAVGLARIFRESFRRTGSIATDESFGSDDVDFRIQLTKIKSVNPDVIYFAPQTPNKGELVFRQMKELGITAPVIMDALMIRGILEKDAKLVEGVIGVEPKFDQQAPRAASFFKAYNEKHGTPTFPFYDAATYDAVFLIADALKRHGEKTEAIRDYLYAVKNYPGTIGSLTFDKNGDLVMDFSVVRVKGGKITELQ